MKVYIVHYDKLTERRVSLEQALKQRGLDGDVEWVTEYPKEHGVVDKILRITPTKLSRGYISTNLKHYEALYRMCRDNVPEALIFEDDVKFSDYWDVSKIPREFSYVKLGVGVPDMGLKPGNTPLCIGNNAGAEAYYVKRMFARDFLENIDVCWTIETEQHAYMIQNSIPLICVPMCSQDFVTSVNENKDYGISWIEYVRDAYPNSRKLCFPRFALETDEGRRESTECL